MKHILITTIAAVVLVGCGPNIPIHEAAETGNIEAVKKHLAAGVDVNAKNKNGTTPLHYAARGGHKEVAELLIAKGADVDAKADDGWTPLHYAAVSGRKVIVELLIAKGGDVNAEEVDSWTPLFFATGEGHKEITELLIAKGADVNAKDGNEWTPLHNAAWEGHKEVVELLIAEGANVNAIMQSGSFEGMTPIDRAIENNQPETADLLRKHGGKTKKELEAAGKPTEPVAEAAQPEPPTAKTADASLWEAAMFGKIEAAKKAIADGANVNAKKDDGETPLHSAVVAALDSGDKEVVELLITNGADVNAKVVSGRKQGMTPLDAANVVAKFSPLPTTVKNLSNITALLRKHGGKTGEELKAEGK